MVAFVLSLVSLVILFFSYEFGAIFAVLSIVVAIINRKKPSKFTIPAIVISVIVFLVSLVCFIKTAVELNNINEETKDGVNKINEKYNNE